MAKYSSINDITNFISNNFVEFGGFCLNSGYSQTKIFRILENLNAAIDNSPIYGASYDAITIFDNGETMNVNVEINRNSRTAESGEWEVRVIPA